MTRNRVKYKIAIIAPLALPIPPKKQGGTEWVVYHQANGLVERGHQVALLAIADSRTKAKLIPIALKGASEYKIRPARMEASRALRLEIVYLAKMMAALDARIGQLDLVFNHARGGEVILPWTKHWQTPIAHILHLPLFKEVAELYQQFNAPLISISYSQRRGFANLNWAGNVYNGVDIDQFKPLSRATAKTTLANREEYVLMITTIGEHKNTLDGILAAKKAGIKLIIAGKIRDQDYFQKKIKPLIDQKRIIYLGEVGLRQKIKLYQQAQAFLMPIVWSEPFGLVMIEAMACGTPVIGYPYGAVQEVVKDKQTGFVVKNVSEMAQAIKKISQINRFGCRRWVEDKFSVAKMAKAYEQVCDLLISKQKNTS